MGNVQVMLTGVKRAGREMHLLGGQSCFEVPRELVCGGTQVERLTLDTIQLTVDLTS